MALPFEYIGIRSVFQGLSQFRSDTASFNQAIQTTINAVNDQAKQASSASQAMATAWAQQAASAKASLDSQIAKLGQFEAELAKAQKQLLVLQALQAQPQTRTATGQFAPKGATAADVANQLKFVQALDKEVASTRLAVQAAQGLASSRGAVATFGNAFAAAAQVGQQSINLLSGAVRESLNTLQQLGKIETVAAAGGTIALAGATVYAAKSYGDFDQTLKNNQAATRSSATDVAKLGDTILTLGRNTGVPIKDIQDMSDSLTRVGVTAREQTDGVLKASNNLVQASAGAISFNDAAKQVITSLREYNLPASDAGQVSDIITTALHRTTLTAQDFFTAFKQAAPIMNDLNISFADTSVIIATLGNKIASGAITGAGLGQMFQRLINPGKEARKVLNDWGVSLQDSQGKIRPVVDVIGNMVDAFSPANAAARGNTEIQREQAITTIFNTRAQKDAFAAINTSKDAWNSMFGAIRNSTGAAQQSADVINQALNKQLQELGNSLKADAILMGGEFAGALRTGSQALKGFLDSPQTIANVRAFGLALGQLATQEIPRIIQAAQQVGTFFGQLNDRFNLGRVAALAAGLALASIVAPAILLLARMVALAAALQALNALWQAHPALVIAAAASLAVFVAAANVQTITNFANSVAVLGRNLAAIATFAAPVVIVLAAIALSIASVISMVKGFQTAVKLATGQITEDEARQQIATQKATDLIGQAFEGVGARAQSMAQEIIGAFNSATGVVQADAADMTNAANQAFAAAQLTAASVQAQSLDISNPIFEAGPPVLPPPPPAVPPELGGGGTGAAPYDAAASGAKKAADKQKEWTDAIRASVQEIGDLTSQYQISANKVSESLKAEIAKQDESLQKTINQSKAEADLAIQEAQVAETQRSADEARSRALDEQIKKETQLFQDQQKAAQQAFADQQKLEQQKFDIAETAREQDLKNQQAVAKENTDYQTKLNDLQAKEAAKLATLKTAQQKAALEKSTQLQVLTLGQQHDLNLKNLAINAADQQAQDALSAQIQQERDAFAAEQQKKADAFAQQQQMALDAFQVGEDQKRLALQDQMNQEALARQIDRIQKEQARRDQQARENHDTAIKDDQDRAAQELANLDKELQLRLNKVKENLDKTLAKLQETDAQIAAEDATLSTKLINNANLVGEAANAAARQLAALFGKGAPPAFTPIQTPAFPAVSQKFAYGGTVEGMPGYAVPAYLHPGEVVVSGLGVTSGGGSGGGGGVTNNFNSSTWAPNVNANYAGQQSPSSILLDLAALEAMARR